MQCDSPILKPAVSSCELLSVDTGIHVDNSASSDVSHKEHGVSEVWLLTLVFTVVHSVKFSVIVGVDVRSFASLVE